MHLFFLALRLISIGSSITSEATPIKAGLVSDPVLTRLNTALEGRYRIERELGKGGMATVYLADDLRHGRKVAVKVLSPSLSAVLGTERFLREIDVIAKLQHPHLLTLIDSGEAGGMPYYVMPYVEGQSLRARLDREDRPPVDESLRFAAEIAPAGGDAQHSAHRAHAEVGLIGSHELERFGGTESVS